MPVADHWYSSSANLISIVGTAVTFLSALIGAWVVYWLTVPRCRLRYALVYAIPIKSEKMENRASGSKSDEVPPSSLSNPYQLEIQLSAHGSRDISSAAFDEGRPLILDCGVPLIAQSINVYYTPGSVLPPKTTVNGSALEVGPGLINRHHVLSYSILAEGAKESIRLVCRSSLTDVAVRRDRKDKEFNLLDIHSAQSRGSRRAENPPGWGPWLIGILIIAILPGIPALLHFLSTIISPIVLGIIAGVIAIVITTATVVYVRRQGLSN